MDREHQLTLLHLYNEKLKGWEPERSCRTRTLPVAMSRGIKHARWMILEMIQRLEEGEESSPGQADRWIGFVQALLWSHGLFSIDDMAKANTSSVDSDHP